MSIQRKKWNSTKQVITKAESSIDKQNRQKQLIQNKFPTLILRLHLAPPTRILGGFEPLPLRASWSCLLQRIKAHVVLMGKKKNVYKKHMWKIISNCKLGTVRKTKNHTPYLARLEWYVVWINCVSVLPTYAIRTNVHTNSYYLDKNSFFNFSSFSSL